MKKSVSDRILEQKLSKGQQKIADYILDNYKKVGFMTAAKLAEKTCVSQATVVRFATTMGFSGYHDFQLQLQEESKTQLTTVQRLEIASEHFTKGNLILDVLKSDIDKIEKTKAEIDVESFKRAVSGMLVGEHIYIVGVRSSAPLATFFGFYLNLIMDNVKIITSTGAEDITEQLLHVTDRDVVMGISFPRYSAAIVKGLGYAKDKGAYVIALSDSKSSPIVSIASCVLLAKSDMNSFADSLVAPMSVLNALIFAIGYTNKEKTEKTFDELEKLWSEYEVYNK